MCRENLRDYFQKTHSHIYVGFYLFGYNSKSILECWLSHDTSSWLSSLGGIKIWLVIPKVLFHKVLRTSDWET